MPETWVATSFGALDIRDHPLFAGSGLEIMLLPTQPSVPIDLQGEPAALWRALAESPVPDADLSPSQQDLVREFARFGFASSDPSDPARTTAIPAPWLSSPLHELVYSMVTHIAREAGVEIVFIKGPALYKQGLREHEHSGDVDLWADPNAVGVLCDALTTWGWTRIKTVFDGLPLNHSISMEPTGWGCEIDIHFSFPGVGLSSAGAFALLRENSVPISFAGTRSRVPAMPVHAVISALHQVRPLPSRSPSRETQDAAARILSGIGPAAIEASQALRADGALAPVLELAFPTDFSGPTSKIPLNWHWRNQGNTFAAYLIALRLVPRGDRFRYLRQLLWPSREYMRARDDTAGTSSQSVTGARYRRLTSAIKRALSDTHHRHRRT